MRCREAGIPDEVEFATKGELAKRMLERAFEAGVPAEWVVGDTLYGYDELRMWLDEQQKNYVLAVPETHPVWVQGDNTRRALAALLPRGLGGPLGRRGQQGTPALRMGVAPVARGDSRSARAGALSLDPAQSGGSEQAGLLSGGGPAQTTLPEVVRVAGSRWKIEEAMKKPKAKWDWTSMKCARGAPGTGL